MAAGAIDRMTPANAKITILVDNRAAAGLLAEHGLSLWIEAGGRRILFDTGQSALEFNARILGLSLEDADAVVLSHGHYDHTGGIPEVLRDARNVEVYSHPGAARSRYAVLDGKARSIRMPDGAASSLGKVPPERRHAVLGPLMLSGRIGLTGPIARDTDFEDTGGSFFLDPEGRTADPIEDDLALWVRTEEGLVVCAGCAHAGIVNTLEHVRRIAGGQRIRGVVGGLHLKEASPERMRRTVAALRSMDPEIIVPCHCTGEGAVAALLDAFGERVTPGAAGMTFRFGAKKKPTADNDRIGS